MQLKKYIQTNFPGLTLKPNLTSEWKPSLHLELAKGLYPFKEGSDELNPVYFQTVYHQAISLFHDLFSAEDEILLVMNSYRYKKERRKKRRKLGVYLHYIKSKDVRSRLTQATLPYMFEDDEEKEEKYTCQFSLRCRKQDIRYSILIKAICNQDFPPLKPSIHNPSNLEEPDIFFMNTTRNIIFYMYDDRGCEVIARDREAIRPIYEKYADWLDESNRAEIDQYFT